MHLKSYFDKVYFCAGARNESLVDYFESPLEFILDERMASFMALGESKMRKKIAICTTSGTAALECIPALCEAFYSGLDLTLITADRPRELIDSAAPQTIDQLNPISSFTHQQLSCESLDEVKIVKGVNHINIHLGSSLGDKDDKYIDNSLSKTLFLFSHGLDNFSELYDLIHKKTDYFYFEVLSGQSHKNIIKNERELLRLYKRGSFDSVIRVGHTPLSKLWRLLDETHLPVLHLDPRGFRGLSYGELKTLDETGIYKYLESLQITKNELTQTDYTHTQNLIEKYPQSQFAFIRELANKLSENSHLYLGNSSLIRDFEVAYHKQANFYGNRGANGIDGQLASAIGIAKNLDETLYICLGDLTLEYDLSSLAYLPENCRLIIFNNKGGRIFERVKANSKIILAHKRNYQAHASAYNLSYAHYEKANLQISTSVTELLIDAQSTLNCFKEL
tara:strand:- start:128594 stop:129943 length:1350 start_codon:yes stop_codon:yes gene_type:complete